MACGSAPGAVDQLFTGQLDDDHDGGSSLDGRRAPSARTREQPVAAWTYDALSRRSAMTPVERTQTHLQLRSGESGDEHPASTHGHQYADQQGGVSLQRRRESHEFDQIDEEHKRSATMRWID